MRRTGGCPFAVDPTLDAREAKPFYRKRRCARLVPDANLVAEHFDLWAIPGRKSLTTDDPHLRLHVDLGSESFDILVSEELHDGDGFACAVSMNSNEASARAVLDLAFCLLRRPRMLTRDAVSRPSRGAVIYARALQALDGTIAGASQREIAAALFGEARVAADWSPDGELRAQVRYLIQRGRALMRDGYRTLLD
jgi:hypothetical protein